VFTGGAVVGLFFLHGLSLSFFLWSVFLFLLLFLLLYDIAHMVLPGYALYGSLLFAFLIALFSHGGLLLVILGSGIITFFFYLLHLFSKGRALGFGDVILVAALALSVGSPAMWIGTLFAFWIGAISGIILLFRKYGGIKMGVAIPFGPFLILGFLCAYLFEQPLIDLLGSSIGFVL
jgi:leader peptidase (prepilin peptidase)/N-methyltransferase